jgi:cytochrome P450
METLQKIPRSGGRGVLGDGIDISRDFLGWLQHKQAELGDIYEGKLLSHKLVVVTEPSYIQYLLQENNRNYHKSFGYEILKLFLGQGLLTSEGDFWLRQRRLSQPAFHKKRMAAMAKVMTDAATATALDWEKKRQAGQTLAMMPEMMQVTMKIVADALFSADVSSDIGTISTHLGRLNEFAMKRIKSPIKLPLWLPVPRSFRFKKSREAIDAVIFRIIDSRRAHNQPHDDLLAMLMETKDEETGEQMTNLQLRDEVITIFVAGHETTALTMSWMWALLGRHPKVYDRLQAELKTVLAGRDCQMEDLPQLLYTRQVIDEALRLYPPAWVIGRRPFQDDHLGEYKVEKGSNVLMFTYGMHRHPKLWERPDDFWPERWETDRVKNLPRFAYLPFGGGPRICIGNNFALMEMTILLATLAQRFRLVPVSNELPKMDPLITLRPRGDVEMRFR